MERIFYFVYMFNIEYVQYKTKQFWLQNRYATQSAFTEVPASAQGNGITITENNQQLRALLVNGDFFLGTVLASTLTKLALRAAEVRILQNTFLILFLYSYLLLSVGHRTTWPKCHSCRIIVDHHIHPLSRCLHHPPSTHGPRFPWPSYALFKNPCRSLYSC